MLRLSQSDAAVRPLKLLQSDIAVRPFKLLQSDAAVRMLRLSQSDIAVRYIIRKFCHDQGHIGVRQMIAGKRIIIWDPDRAPEGVLFRLEVIVLFKIPAAEILTDQKPIPSYYPCP